MFTFNILLIIVLGGMGSITGSIISAFIVTIAQEVLRFLDETMNLGFIVIKGKVGMRAVVFSALLMIVVLFYRHGLMGGLPNSSWERFFELETPVLPFWKRELLKREEGSWMPILELNQITMQFGGLTAVKDFDMEINPGNRGFNRPNGAGKTTVFNMITGVYKPTRGAIIFRTRILPV